MMHAFGDIYVNYILFLSCIPNTSFAKGKPSPYGPTNRIPPLNTADLKSLGHRVWAVSIRENPPLKGML